MSWKVRRVMKKPGEGPADDVEVEAAESHMADSVVRIPDQVT